MTNATEQQPLNSFTFVHFLIGIFVGLLGVQFLLWLFLHIVFEFWESSTAPIGGIAFFATFDSIVKSTTGQRLWPPYKGDSLVNSVLDTTAAMLGWVIGYGIRVNHMSATG